MISITCALFACFCFGSLQYFAVFDLVALILMSWFCNFCVGTFLSSHQFGLPCLFILLLYIQDIPLYPCILSLMCFVSLFVGFSVNYYKKFIIKLYFIPWLNFLLAKKYIYITQETWNKANKSRLASKTYYIHGEKMNSVYF